MYYYFLIGFFTDDIRLWKKEQKEMEINQEEVRQVAKKHLEDKYGESFIVKKEINEETRSIKNIKEIRDGYGWKFFKEGIREELEKLFAINGFYYKD